MTGFALYRLPRQQLVTLVAQTHGQPQQLLSCQALNGQRGFVVAPFSIGEACPLVLLRPDRVQTFDTPECLSPEILPSLSLEKTPFVFPSPIAAAGRSTYSSDFSRFHANLLNGRFSKLVLSRCVAEPVSKALSPLMLFQRACRRYPRLFISLVYTPQSGLWLTATPEILLECTGSQWRTIALAGTLKLEGEALMGEGENVTWSTKNIQEQRYVASYLKDCLKNFADDVREEGPRTVRAANLVHLRSDFVFTLYNNTRAGELLQALHPTPAVCGLPKQEAFRFVLDSEHTPRRYYSGFMGPLGLGGAIHLYVSLRCMQITPTHYRLYAGGGLLRNSIEEQEWQETEAKLETMRALITQPS